MTPTLDSVISQYFIDARVKLISSWYVDEFVLNLAKAVTGYRTGSDYYDEEDHSSATLSEAKDMHLSEVWMGMSAVNVRLINGSALENLRAEMQPHLNNINRVVSDEEFLSALLTNEEFESRVDSVITADY